MDGHDITSTFTNLWPHKKNTINDIYYNQFLEGIINMISNSYKDALILPTL